MQGRGLDLIRLLYNPLVVRVDAGTGRVNVKEQTALPQGSSVQLESMTPASFEIKLDSLLSRRLPVENRVRIEMAEAYELIDSFRQDIRPSFEPHRDDLVPESASFSDFGLAYGFRAEHL